MGLVTELVLTNIAPINVTYNVEIFDETATVLSGESGTIIGPGQARVSLETIDADAFGVRVTGDGPFGAVVIGRGGFSRRRDGWRPNCFRPLAHPWTKLRGSGYLPIVVPQYRD